MDKNTQTKQNKILAVVDKMLKLAEIEYHTNGNKGTNLIYVKNEEKVERENFFKSLAKILSFLNDENFIVQSKISSHFYDNDNEDNLCWGVTKFKTLNICLDEEILLSHTVAIEESIVKNSNNIQKKKMNKYIGFSKICTVLKPLTSEYPYLEEYFIPEMLKICSNNDGYINEIQTFKLIQNYANCYFEPEERCKVLNKIIDNHPKNLKN